MHYGLDTDQFELDAQLKKRLTNSKALYLSAMGVFCEPSGCLTLNDRQLTAWDEGHLTDTGSKILVAEIVRQLRLD